mmetsp:Transcript_9030/g.19904  ORF Transcript_9030/g.19904 Transcript_9030/m.19904 type:complete len:239 (-) Transcript_9030:210-926(-)
MRRRGTSASDSSGSGISISIPASSPEALQPIVPFSPLGKRARPSYSPLSYAAAGTDSPQGPFVCYICHGVEGSPEALLQCHDAECTDPHAYYHVNCVHDMDIGTKFYCAACTQARDLGRGCEEGGSDQSFPGSRFQDSQNPRFQVPRFPLKRSPGPQVPHIPQSPGPRLLGEGGKMSRGGGKRAQHPSCHTATHRHGTAQRLWNLNSGTSAHREEQTQRQRLADMPARTRADEQTSSR